MALDHYVSQVHLRNFYSSSLNGMTHALRKKDLKYFPARSEDVCRIDNGNTNKYLEDPRAVEEFLKKVEPRYNRAVSALRENSPTEEDVFAIAGFIAYVASCSPAAMRINTAPLQDVVKSTARVLDRMGKIPKAPPSLGGKTLTELLDDGSVVIDVDRKYPQAIGVSTIMSIVRLFGNSLWEVLINPHEGSPFFTSDYPIALDIGPPGTPQRVMVPLTPDLMIKISPDPNQRDTEDLSFPEFRGRNRTLGRQEVLEINRLIVRCAEDLVFYSKDVSWVRNFVSKNSQYWIEPVNSSLPLENGFLNISTRRIAIRPPYGSVEARAGRR